MGLKTRVFVPAKDYGTVTRFHVEQNRLPPALEDIPETSWVMEEGGEILLFASMILTNIRLGWIDHFVGNPRRSGALRRLAAKEFICEFLPSEARKLGLRRFVGFVSEDALQRYYVKEFGFSPVQGNMTLLLKDV